APRGAISAYGLARRLLRTQFCWRKRGHRVSSGNIQRRRRVLDGGAASMPQMTLEVSLGVPPSPSRLMGWPSDAAASLFLPGPPEAAPGNGLRRSEEHTSELQALAYL